MSTDRWTDEWIKKIWYVYTMEYYSVIKNNEFGSVVVRWMNPEPVIQSEVKSEREKQIMYITHIYMGSRKNSTDEPI